MIDSPLQQNNENFNTIPTGDKTPRSLFLTLILFSLILVAPSGLIWIISNYPSDHLLENTSFATAHPSLSKITIYCAVFLCGIFFIHAYAQRMLFAGSIFEALHYFNRRFFILITLPFVALLVSPAIESKRPNLAIFCAFAIAALTTTYTYMNLHQKIRPRRVIPISPQTGFIFTCLSTIGFALLLNHFATLNTKGLRFPSFDLAIYHNIIWHTFHGSFLGTTLMKGGTHMSAHFDPFLVTLIPFYAIRSDVFSLITVQSFWISLTAIPLYLLNLKILKSPSLATILALTFLLQPALHGIGMYEFHSLAFISPILPLLILLQERKRFSLFFVFLLLSLTIREDIALIVIGTAVYCWDVHKQRLLGVLAIILSLGYLLIVKLFFMPDPNLLMTGTNAYNYASRFSGMIPTSSGGALTFLTSLLTNTEFVIAHAFENDKCLYLFLMFVPTLTTPFFVGRRLVLLIYPLLFILLATSTGHYSVHKQYSAIILPYIWILVPFGIITICTSTRINLSTASRENIKRALVTGICICSLGITARFGMFVPNTSFKSPLWTPVHFLSTDTQVQLIQNYTSLTELITKIPPTATVEATRFALPFLANRPYLQSLRFLESEYLLFRKSEVRGSLLERYNTMRANKTLSLIGSFDDWFLFKNNNGPGPHAKEAIAVTNQ